jgi:hypothetical protein
VTRPIACYFGLLFALAGCSDPLKPVDLIEEPRVLAARIEVDGDPGRVSPLPGEAVHVRWLVATPTGDASSGFALAVCSAATQGHGLAACLQAPFASAGAEPTSDRPSFDFVVPETLEPAQNPRLEVFGALCPEESGSFDASGPRCLDGGGLPVSLGFELLTDAGPNLNPEIPPDAIALDGAPWLAAAPVTEPCQGQGLVELTGAGRHSIEIALPDSDRQDLLQLNSADPARETLQVAHFASAGDLGSAFSELQASSASTRVTVSWDAPAPDAQSRLIRFWFVVRDGRGGSDFTERALCELP